ncbi:MAG: hypothetical protein GY814_09920 [Gammaproteobacteria bacterium]|nr:hypothetical protein [Gammaproteobacteria bacterium]
MSIGKLILYTGDTSPAPPAIELLTQSLQELELIGHPIDSEANSFLPGDSFLQLISFVGCSPNICLTPQTESDFSSVTIRGPFLQPQLIWDRNCRPPRCPGCNKPIPDWEKSFNGSTLNCMRCGTESEAGDINWGRYAGYGRMFIEINNVFPGEATPVDLLFNRLKGETGVEWRYFFTGHN